MMPIEITGGASTTSRSPKRMGTDEVAEFGHGNRVKLMSEKEVCDWQLSLSGPLYGYTPVWWTDAIRHAATWWRVQTSFVSFKEHVAANLLHSFYPDIEAVRWMLNGSDACAAAVKLARAVTGRDKILVYGYHGTASAFAKPPAMGEDGTPREADNRRGTLQAERDAYIQLGWGMATGVEGEGPYAYFFDEITLVTFPPDEAANIAAVIVECPPVDRGKDGATAWLRHLAEWTHHIGALFILDEVVTGFRYGPSGAAGYYDLHGSVDLYCFGKTLGNGAPVACLGGRKSIMDELANEDGKVHFSGTWFGEPIGLSAACATMQRLKDEPPWDYLYEIGNYLKDEWNALELPWKLEGHPTRPVLEPYKVEPERLLDLRQHLFERGHVVVPHPWYVCMATTKADVDSLCEAARGWTG